MKKWTAERIRALRKKRSESQEEFAEHFRCSVGTVQKWEQDKSPPSGAVTVILDLLEKQDLVLA